MSTPFIAAVMVHVPSISEALAWYERVLPNALRSSIAEEEFEFLLVGEVRLELVLADQKVSSGPSGSVVYWQFSQFEEALQRFQVAGQSCTEVPCLLRAANSCARFKSRGAIASAFEGPRA